MTPRKLPDSRDGIYAQVCARENSRLTLGNQRLGQLPGVTRSQSRVQLPSSAEVLAMRDLVIERFWRIAQEHNRTPQARRPIEPQAQKACSHIRDKVAKTLLDRLPNVHAYVHAGHYSKLCEMCHRNALWTDRRTCALCCLPNDPRCRIGNRNLVAVHTFHDWALCSLTFVMPICDRCRGIVRVARDQRQSA
jgi:hypothetical protein